MPFEQQWQEITAKLSRHRGPDQAMRLIRLIRRREMLRIALADGAGVIDLDQVGRALSDDGPGGRPRGPAGRRGHRVRATARSSPTLLVVAMGRQGGREIGYCSDADVMFVHRPLPGADPQAAQEQALRIVSRLGALLGQPLQPAVLAEPRLEVDADLRPEGRAGPAGALARGLPGVLRAVGAASGRPRPCCGPRPWPATTTLAARLHGARRRGALPRRPGGERRPGDPPDQGAGGSRAAAARRGPGPPPQAGPRGAQRRRMAGPAAAAAARRRAPGAAHHLHAPRAAGRWARRGCFRPGTWSCWTGRGSWPRACEVPIVVCTGRPSDVLPSSRRDLEAVARWCGYPAGQAARLEEDYLKTTRRARQVFERHFYGFDG